MNKIKPLFIALLFVGCYGLLPAQNKTLGVGVTTPNANAALHVESPTGNQGFILPRLTTAQRLASPFTTALGAPDNGLMVYDTDLNTIFIWNGSAWQNTGEVAGGVKLTYPYQDHIGVAPETSDLFVLRYSGGGDMGLMLIGNESPDNQSRSLTVQTAGRGAAGFFRVSNPASLSPAVQATINSDVIDAFIPVAIYGESTGKGSSGGAFRITQAENNRAALFAETSGTGTSITGMTATGFSAIYGEATGGTSHGLTGISNSQDPGSFAILGQNNGGGPAGFFKVSSPTNTTNALGVTNAGTGNALFAEMTGTGSAGNFRNNSATNTSPVIIATQSGTGPALQLNQINNGMAIEMTSGGLKYSVAPISTPGNITVLAGLYKITVVGTYSLPTGVPEGTFCKVYFTSADPNDFIVIDPIWVNGAAGSQSIYSGIVDFIFIDGYWHIH